VRWKEAKLAMAVRSKNAHYKLTDIRPRHWMALAERSGVDKVWQAMCDLVDSAELSVRAVMTRLPPGFPEQTAQTIHEGVLRQRKTWEQGLRAMTMSVPGADLAADQSVETPKGSNAGSAAQGPAPSPDPSDTPHVQPDDAESGT
jgi:hypothetical protein